MEIFRSGCGLEQNKRLNETGTEEAKKTAKQKTQSDLQRIKEELNSADDPNNTDFEDTQNEVEKGNGQVDLNLNKKTQQDLTRIQNDIGKEQSDKIQEQVEKEGDGKVDPYPEK